MWIWSRISDCNVIYKQDEMIIVVFSLPSWRRWVAVMQLLVQSFPFKGESSTKSAALVLR